MGEGRVSSCVTLVSCLSARSLSPARTLHQEESFLAAKCDHSLWCHPIVSSCGTGPVGSRAPYSSDNLAGSLRCLARNSLARYPSAVITLASSSSSRARPRLSLIERHLDRRPLIQLNTTLTPERLGRSDSSSDNQQATSEQSSAAMSAQPPHATLLIPGPIEFEDAVLQAMSHYRYVHSFCISMNPSSIHKHPDANTTFFPKANRTLECPL